jgi:hypothetical protein
VDINLWLDFSGSLFSVLYARISYGEILSKPMLGDKEMSSDTLFTFFSFLGDLTSKGINVKVDKISINLFIKHFLH